MTELMPQRPVWGFSNDDMHAESHLGRNWNVLLLDKPTEENIREVLNKGRFYFVYCPKGHKGPKPPKLESITVDEKKCTITVNVDDAKQIQWISDNTTVVGNGATLEIRKAEGIGSYVRAMIYGNKGNTVIGTQPFAIRKKVDSHQ